MDLSKLAEPFEIQDIEWRVSHSGFDKNGNPWAMVLCYVTNRAIQARLDEVVGAMNWKNEYRPAPEGGVMCGISIWNEDRKEWVTKYDGAENTQVESVKGGMSGAMKRAAVQWGIGRYLYKLEATFAQCFNGTEGQNQAKDAKTKKRFTWNDPALPAWALPVVRISKQQISKFHAVLQGHDDLKDHIKDALGIESIKDMAQSDFDRSITWIKKKVEQRKNIKEQPDK